MTLPLTMSGYERTYRPPRSLREHVGAEVTAWDLFRLEHDEQAGAWAASTLASVVASADAESAGALGCTECLDTGFYGAASPDDPDLLLTLVRRFGDSDLQSLTTDGSWEAWGDGQALEVLDLETAADLAGAITAGASGLLRLYGQPRAFLPPADGTAVQPLGAVISAAASNTPQAVFASGTYALVHEQDPGAVIDLYRIVAASPPERYDGDQWVPADQDLPGGENLLLVRLGEEHLADVMRQLAPGDAIVADAPLTVSPDPRAERLRRYWSSGRGAFKIKWGLPRDWVRCYRHLRKYMGPRAKGYCQNLHRRNTGMWTGDRRNRGVRGSALDVRPSALLQVAGATEPVPAGSVHHIFRTGEVVTLAPTQACAGAGSSQVRALVGEFEVVGVDVSPVVASVAAGTKRVGVVQDVVYLSARGNGPAMDNPRSTVGDRIAESPGAVSVAVPVERAGPPPSPVRHDLVVRLKAAHDQIRGAGVHEAGVMLRAQPSLEAARNAGCVVDATSHGFYCTHPNCGFVAQCAPEVALLAALRSGRVSGDTEGKTTMPDTLTDGVYTETDSQIDALLAAIEAKTIPVAAPDNWFDDPKLDRPTTVTVTDEGRVYGHIAPWGVTHIGMAGSVTAPKNPDGKYAYFRTGQHVTASGKSVRVGQLTLNGGHAPMEANVASVVKHYDDTHSAVADVAVGEDAHGIWAAGVLRPSVTPEQVRVMRASPPSGDWRRINGQLELVAACHVNVQGFPIAACAYQSGTVQALVAAGARQMAELSLTERADAAVVSRLDRLDQLVASLAASETEPAPEPDPSAPQEPPPASEDDNPAAAETQEPEVEFTEEELARAAKIARAREEIASAKRDALRARVNVTAAAMPEQFKAHVKGKDGSKAKSTIKGTDSFPIGNVADLKRAIQAFGRAGDKPAAKKHIMSMAYKLKRPDLIPDNWRGGK